MREGVKSLHATDVIQTIPEGFRLQREKFRGGGDREDTAPDQNRFEDGTMVTNGGRGKIATYSTLITTCCFGGLLIR